MTAPFDTSDLPDTYYTVTVRRTELIAFELKARSPADARKRYLTDGDEVGSHLIDHTIVDVAGSPRNLEHTWHKTMTRHPPNVQLSPGN